MSTLRLRTPISVVAVGATVADLGPVVADAPPDVTARLDAERDPVRLVATSGFGSPHGGARGVAVLDVSEEPGPRLRITGQVRPGRLNLVVVVPFTAFAVLFVSLGLLLMIGNPEAVGLVVMGAIFAGVVWVVRSVERPYVERVAAGVSQPDGWLLSGLAAAAREHPDR